MRSPTSGETADVPLRLFIAVPAPEEVRAAAAERTRPFRGLGDVRWVAPENLHLTLKFLGDTPLERVPLIAAALERIANGFSRFVVSLGGVSAFPNLNRPRTLWLGLGGEVERLVALAGAIDAGMQPLGYPKEKGTLRPHLTIGRVRSPKGLSELSRELKKKVADDPQDGPHWPVTEFHLIRSVLRPSGPEYTSLAGLPLGGAADPTPE